MKNKKITNKVTKVPTIDQEVDEDKNVVLHINEVITMTNLKDTVFDGDIIEIHQIHHTIEVDIYKVDTINHHLNYTEYNQNDKVMKIIDKVIDKKVKIKILILYNFFN